MKPLSAGERVFAFFVIVIFLVFGMVLVWKELPFSKITPVAPMPSPVIAPTSTVPVAQPAVPVIVPPPVSTTTMARLRPLDSICDETNSICVSSSTQHMLLTSPFSVTGTAVAFENQFSWDLVDTSTAIAWDNAVQVSSSDVGIPGDFSIRGFIRIVPSSATGTLRLFELSPKDGKPIHELKIPVRLPLQTMSVKIYTMTVADPKFEGYSCPNEPLKADSIEEKKIVRTKFPIEETASLFFVRSFAYSSGVVSVTVQHGEEDDACYVRTVDAGIEKTLLQFPAVQKVLITDIK